MRFRFLALAVVAFAAAAAAAPSVHAQGIGSRIKQRVQDKVAQKVDSLADTLSDAAVNKTAGAINCIATDKACIKKANAAGKPVVVTDKAGKPLPNQEQAAREAGVTTSAGAASGGAGASSAGASDQASAYTPPGQGVWLNYDFIPGDRTIFVEDFSGNDVGDFPRRLRLVEGNMEVVKVKGQPMLRSADGGNFYVVLPEKLPDRFTVEVRFHSNVETNPIYINSTPNESATLGCYPRKAFVEENGAGGANSGGDAPIDLPPGFVNCTFTVDNGKGIKGYIDEHRTANAPQTHMKLTDTLYFQVPSADPNDPILVSSIRVAAGGKKLYDVLAAKGRVSTQGILFDTGSDRIRPESTPTLKEIGEMLSEHPDLKLAIEGHTDNVGQPAANQTLSEKRAAAVKAYLVSTMHVDAARLESVGFGASKPASPNTTAEGRQNNRRVELVKK